MSKPTVVTSLSVAVLLGACAEPQLIKNDERDRPDPARSEVELVEEIRQASPQDPAAKPKPAEQAHAELRAESAVVAKLSRMHSAADIAAVHPLPGLHPPPTLVDRENYLSYEDNPVKRTSEHPVSTFSVDVDTAAYANVRRMLVREGRLPPGDAVRTEEMINYFSYHYDEPDSHDFPFSINTEMAPAPWAEGRYLLQVGLKGFEPALEKRPPANLVFLVDVSGSMRSPDKLGLVKKSLRLLVNKMGPEDRIALAVYAGAAGTVLESTPGSEKAKILAAIDALEAGGSTHGSAGIQLAYALAEQHKIEGGINRVLIASDGDMNVGTVNIEALKDLIEQKRENGVALTTLGFGTGNYNYSLMEQLADVGNGNAAYIDSMKEAQKVLVNEMQSTLLTIAKDVKIQVEFNPAQVSEYRLIGYENRLLNREDFTNDKVDAGDIGAGHTVTALYEVTLAGGEQRIPELRYGNAAPLEQGIDFSTELAYVKLRYKQPGGTKSSELGLAIQRRDIEGDLSAASDDLRFAASVAGFSDLLKGGTHSGDWHFDDALQLARGARGQDDHGYRSEFIHLIELAQSLSSQG